MRVIKNFLVLYILAGCLLESCSHTIVPYRLHYIDKTYSIHIPNQYKVRTLKEYNEWYFYYPDSTILFILPAATYPTIIDDNLGAFGFRSTLIDLPLIELQGAQPNGSYWKLFKVQAFHVGFRNVPQYRKEFYTEQLNIIVSDLTNPKKNQ